MNEEEKKINKMDRALADIGRGYDGSDGSREHILKNIEAFSFSRTFDEDEIERILYWGAWMMERDVLDCRAFVQRVAVPLAHQVEDDALLRNSLGFIGNNMLLFDAAGEVLGDNKLDRLTFEALAMLLQKLSRTRSSGKDSSFVFARESADLLVRSLACNPNNDPDLLDLVRPYTTRGKGKARRPADTHALQYKN
jgi:hypothetical protein